MEGQAVGKFLPGAILVEIARLRVKPFDERKSIYFVSPERTHPSVSNCSPNLVEGDGPNVAVLARAEGVLLADDQEPTEGWEVLLQARLNLLDRRVRGNIPGGPQP